MSSQDTLLERLNYHINGSVTLCVTMLGMVCNLLSILVLTRRSMRSSTSCYQIARAVWDFLLLLTASFLIGFEQTSETFRQTIHPYVVVYAYPLALLAQTATVWLTVSFSVERYVAVCHPLKVASLCTLWRARLVITVVSFCACLANLSRWFDYKTAVVLDLAANRTRTVFALTDFGRNETYHKLYYMWFYMMFMGITPLVSLAVFNAFLISAIRQSRHQQRCMNVRQSRDNNVAIMSVLIVFAFIVCQTPAVVYNTAYAVQAEAVQADFYWNVVSSCRNLLVEINSVVNFILYCVFGRKFRRAFLQTVCRKCMLSRRQSISTHRYVPTGRRITQTRPTENGLDENNSYV